MRMAGDRRRWDRRALLRAVGVGLGVAPLARLLAACDDSGGARVAADTSTATDTTTTATDAAAGTDAGADAGGDTTVATAWATGGTAAMTAKASYPDPFAAGGGSSCELMCQATIGPCHTTSPERQDVSDGWDGMPVRLALELVDEGCNPIEDAIVEIWHTNHQGVYSGRINAMCNATEAERAAQFFRGYQRTDANGRVDFDTCFPGWYRGRAVHIHFRVQTGTYDASDSAAAVVVSQLFFTDELVSEIFDGEPLYEDFGQPDTWLTNDNIIGGTNVKTPYVCDVQRTSDGAMLASKRLVVRASTATANCSL